MANQLDGSKRSNQIYELDSIRYLREEDAADIFGLPYSTVLYFAQAAGAVYQLPKITLIHRKQMEKYMNHLHKVPNTGKYVQKKFVRIGEGSITYSIGHHRFIEMARAAGAVYKINEGTGGTTDVLMGHVVSHLRKRNKNFQQNVLVVRIIRGMIIVFLVCEN